MATDTPAQRSLAKALTDLRSLQDAGRNVIHTDDLDRSSREALIKNGFLKAVIRGWYVPSRPDEGDGESTAWYASTMEFVARYCESRFDAEWCVSPDYSVRLHAGNPSLPRQVFVHTPKGQNTPLHLPAEHSTRSLHRRIVAAPLDASSLTSRFWC